MVDPEFRCGLDGRFESRVSSAGQHARTDRRGIWPVISVVGAPSLVECPRSRFPSDAVSEPVGTGGASALERGRHSFPWRGSRDGFRTGALRGSRSPDTWDTFNLARRQVMVRKGSGGRSKSPHDHSHATRSADAHCRTVVPCAITVGCDGACPLAVWGPSGGGPLLPESPEMLFGTLLHVVRRRFLHECGSSTDRLSVMQKIFADEVQKLEGTLAVDERQECLPLRTRVGWRKWSDRVRRLDLWAESVEVSHTGAPSINPIQSDDAPGPKAFPTDTSDSFWLGVEPWWQCAALRLRGSPDEVHEAAGNILEITDYKSGAVFDRDDQVRTEIVTQLQLYALMAEHLEPRYSVRLYVHHARRQDVHGVMSHGRPYSSASVTSSERFPERSNVDASEIASPGAPCIGCRLRPRCPRYLHDVPQWWSNAPGNPRPLPLDVWGELQSVEHVGATLAARLKDQVGRIVQVEGLRDGGDLDRSMADATLLFFFDLESTEDVFRHGSLIHPRNFHG